jgi:4'-phosphopantetheinyl transferase
MDPTSSASSVLVHLHLAILDEIQDAASPRYCRSLLSPQERTRLDSIRLERSRREFLYAHALLRLALSWHAPHRAPERWRFAATAGGKPVIAGPTNCPTLHFNLSHTNGVVACVVASEPLLGLDVEWTDHPSSTMDVVAGCFAPPEKELLRRLSPHAQRDWFFRLWTLKESYAKARGLGLALPLDQFWFSRSTADAITIEFGGGIIDTASRWRFAERQPTPQHRLAIAVAGGGDPASPLEVIEHQWPRNIAVDRTGHGSCDSSDRSGFLCAGPSSARISIA